MTGLEKLREIGAHKIFEKTHIAKKFVEDILNQNYSTMNRVQFTGFISILEREYGVDLHALIEGYHAQKAAESASEPFVVSEQESSLEKGKGQYVIAALILAGVLFIGYNLASGPSESEKKSTESVQTEAQTQAVERNITSIEEAKTHLASMENNASETLQEEEVIEPIHTSKFQINPHNKLWVGIVDLEDFSRSQKLISEPLELDADKSWLLVMGHGYVDFEVNGEEQKYTDEKKVWFAYENGVLTKLSRSEFKAKNRGQAW